MCTEFSSRSLPHVRSTGVRWLNSARCYLFRATGLTEVHTGLSMLLAQLLNNVPEKEWSYICASCTFV